MTGVQFFSNHQNHKLVGILYNKRETPYRKANKNNNFWGKIHEILSEYE